VGIGTNEPDASLHVLGNVKFESSIEFKNIDTSSNRPLSTDYFLTLSAEGKIIARPWGNVAMLDPAPLTICDLAAPGGGPYVNLHPQWHSETNKIYVPCPEVFVGISTFTPRTSLDVRGTSYTNKLMLGSGMTNPDVTGGTSATFHLKATINSSPTIQNQTIFIVENTDRRLFQIQNNGMVRAREIKVDLATNWPDYVFKPTYSLMPLEDVKNYIAQNGHLPNILAANLLEKDGLPLGEMNRLLMEKVEELTLYMIQLKEEQERLKLELEELKTKK
jgi:hypothetical protein